MRIDIYFPSGLDMPEFFELMGQYVNQLEKFKSVFWNGSYLEVTLL